MEKWVRGKQERLYSKIWNCIKEPSARMFSVSSRIHSLLHAKCAGVVRCLGAAQKTLFERIADRSIPSDIIYEDDKVRIGSNSKLVLCL